MDYRNVQSFLKQHKNYHWVKENSYSATFQSEPDKNGKVKTVVVMESYFWKPKSEN